MTTITIDEARYSEALSFAKAHNKSIQELVDEYLGSLHLHAKPSCHKISYKVSPIEELPMKLQALIGIARSESVAPSKDINGRDAREEYLKEKYAQ